MKATLAAGCFSLGIVLAGSFPVVARGAETEFASRDADVGGQKLHTRHGPAVILLESDSAGAGREIYGGCAGSAGDWRFVDPGEWFKYEGCRDEHSFAGALAGNRESPGGWARHRADGGVRVCGAVSC
jgi:hypothetical protein